MSDILGLLLDQQKKIMATFGVTMNVNDPNFAKHLQAATIGVVVEGGEVAAEMNRVTRPWKSKSLEDVLPQLLEESIDVLFYLLEIWDMLGLDKYNIASLYNQKWETNLRRVLSIVDEDKRRNILRNVADFLSKKVVQDDSYRDILVKLTTSSHYYEEASKNPVIAAAFLLLNHIGTNEEVIEALIRNPLGKI